MIIEIPREVLERIHRHGENSYPEEGAGLLLGRIEIERKRVEDILALPNAREDEARRNRYLLSPEDYLKGEDEAASRGLEVIGAFHSHPDHPELPSDFDQEWAWPAFSYLITSIRNGKAVASRSWCLRDDRSTFIEERTVIVDPADQLAEESKDQGKLEPL